MKNLITRFHAAFIAAKVAFLEPDIMLEPHFKVMSSLYNKILKVQQDNSPLMCRIAVFVPEKPTQAIATVWIGPGANSSPEQRIKQLFEENRALRQMVQELTTNSDATP